MSGHVFTDRLRLVIPALAWLASSGLAGCGDGSRVHTLHWPDGTIRQTKTVLPQPHGTWIDHGPFCTYFQNGQKEQEGSFQYGRFQGRITRWYENGQVQLLTDWEEGRLVGEPQAWDEGGQPVDPDRFLKPPPKPGIPAPPSTAAPGVTR